jgi:hypothetical protein
MEGFYKAKITTKESPSREKFLSFREAVRKAIS